MINHIFRKIIFFFIVTCCLTASGVPANPTRVKVKVENGDTVEILIRGDEYLKYAVSEDGYLLSPQNDSWYYIQKMSESEISVSNIQLRKTIKNSYKDNLIRTDSKIAYLSPKRNINRHKRQCISEGVSHALIILMEYPDKRFIKSKQEITELFNKIGYDEDKAEGSVRDYYKYASYGKFDLISDIYGPYTTKSTMDFYGGNEVSGSDCNAIELAIEAIDNLPNDIDLSLYDNNNDGIVDNIHIIFAGYGEESGAPSSAIWSHEYPHLLPVTKNDYKFAGYSCTPELRSNMGNGISRIGVICHELGHAFGANDYYDVDYTQNGSYEGTGVWDIMASGSWNNNGINPANFNPYVKIEDFGWINYTVLNESGDISLEPYNFTPSVLKIPTSNPNDYYLLEYRMQKSFDKGLPGEGVLIYHIHPLIESRRATNTLNNSHPQCIYPVCASSIASPFDSSDYGDINSAGCPFPGITNNSYFSAYTTPSAFLWDGTYPNFSIQNISISNEIAKFNYIIDSHNSNDNINESLVYQETFENGLGKFFNESIEGDAIWSIYPTNSLTTLNDTPKPFEGKKALMLYDGNKSVVYSKSLLTSKEIMVNPDSAYVVSFRMRTKKQQNSSYHKITFSIMNSISHKWDVVYENTETINEWTEIKFELPKYISTIYYQISGEVLNSGIFIDDIQIKSIEEANIGKLNADTNNITISYNPLSISAKSSTSVYIYEISGKRLSNIFMTPTSTVIFQLPKGVYIICTDKGETYKVSI